MEENIPNTFKVLKIVLLSNILKCNFKMIRDIEYRKTYRLFYIYLPSNLAM